MQVAMYVRLSEDPKGTGLGVQRQEEECRAWIERQGWSVGTVYRDNDLSATTGVNRPAFEQMLSDGPQAIVCWHMDRLVRKLKELERVTDLDVNIYAVTAGGYDLATPSGRMLARQLTAVAEYEGDQKSARQKAAHRQRVAEGGLTASGRPWWPTRPLGFNLDGSHHETEAPALAQVYADVLRGGTLAGAVRYLDTCGIVTQRSLDLDEKLADEEGREPTGKPWRASSLRPVLLNARNAGIYVYNGEEVGPAAWEGIVSEDVFRAVVRLLTNPARRLNGENAGGFGRRTNLLTGLARCGKCGHTVRAAWRRNAACERTYKVYQCGGCKGVTLPAEWCDSVVSREVIGRVEQWRALLPSKEGTASDIEGMRTRIRGLEASRDELVEDRSLGLLSREQLRAGLARVDAEIAKVTDQLSDATSVDGPWHWDAETLWAWSDDEDGQVDVERFTPVVKRVCKAITLTGPGKGRSTLRSGEHLVIEFHQPEKESRE